MTGLHQQRDVEITKASDGRFDLTPLTHKGVSAVSEYVGVDAEMNSPVRVTKAQYRGFSRFTHDFAKNRSTTFSTGMRPRFRGQRRAGRSDRELPRDPVLPRELSERVSPGRTIHLKDHNFTVTAARYGRPSRGQLFKVTKNKHTPAQSHGLSLGTLSYYRNTVDKHEASFDASGTGVSIHDMEGRLLVGPDTDVHRTFSIDPCWLYCTTSVRGFSSDQSAWLGGDFTATPIAASVNHFARMLGATFGVWSMPRVRQVYSWLESYESLQYTMNGIMVLHGPVRYMRAGERNQYLQSLSRDRSPIEMHENVFTKNDDFEWEREYRFGIWGWGPPLQDHVILPATWDLLDCYGTSVPVGSLAAAAEAR